MARYHNSEGYADTTAYLAEKNIERQEKKRKHIGSGYLIGELYCFKLAVRKLGYRV